MGATVGERRVVHVIRSDSFAGVERYVCDTSAELARRGWEVTVIGGDPERMRSALPDDVSFLPARTTPEVARAIWSHGPVPLLHSHMTAAEAAAAPLKGLRFDRWVTTCHFARPRGSSSLGRVVSPLILKRVDAQIAISQFVADSIPGPSVVIPNGVAPSTQAPRPRDRTVVMVQRLQSEKDTATGLRAWALSGLAGSGWRLRIFGRGSERGQLAQVAAELGIAGSVTFEGFVEDPRAQLASAGIMLATAPAEPFGLSVVEAMAEGVPVVAAAGGAHRETVGDAGRLFPPGDADAAASALRGLAADEPARERIGHELRQRFDLHFRLDRHAAALEAVYAGGPVI